MNARNLKRHVVLTHRDKAQLEKQTKTVHEIVSDIKKRKDVGREEREGKRGRKERREGTKLEKAKMQERSRKEIVRFEKINNVDKLKEKGKLCQINKMGG